jgi:endonuclease/exonuclease/phosphatase family metal-dependent hydrolase
MERGRIAGRAVARSAVALVDSVLRRPGPMEPVPIVGSGAAPVVEPGRPFTVLVWNIQFCAGRSRVFFYDGGDAVHVDRAEAAAAVDGIGRVLREQDADLVLLQEVDRGSDRTGRVDQHAELLARAPYPCHASTPYFRVRYVPHPPGNHLGRVDMHLSVFSRFSAVTAVRHALPAVASEGWLTRQFSLRRAVLELTLPVADGRALRVCDVHLSAFTHGDGTLPLQIDGVAERLRVAGREGALVLAAGDFNALPPGDDPARLGVDAGQYADDGEPMRVLFDAYRSGIPREAHEDEPERWRTWLPFGSPVAERAIDHLFVGPGLEILDAAVLSGVSDLSDHLPLRFEVAVTPLS